MASLLTGCARTLAWGAVAALSASAWGVVPYQPNGSQYALVGSLPGDQTRAQVALSRTGGFVVWQDNVTDGDGFGISARRLDANYSGDRNVFRVNTQGQGNQENPQIALLRDGSAVIVWQGGTQGSQDIFARFVGSNGFTTSDILVNSYVQGQQAKPVVAALVDGTIVVAWSSVGQDGSMQGVYAQRLSASGERIGSEVQVAQSTLWNQRDPSIAALANGGFVVSWISEVGSDLTGEFAVNAQARVFSTSGPAGNEFMVNHGTNVCAAPSVAAGRGDGFMVVWSEQDLATEGAGWEILGRVYDSAGNAKNFGPRLNSNSFRDQVMPRIAAGGEEFLVIWTSIEQSGLRESIFGRFVTDKGVPYSEEFRVNARTTSLQLNPSVTSDGNGQFVATWSSFMGGEASYDLFAQRFLADNRPIPQPATPIINALSSSELLISWPEQSGMEIQGYDLFIDNASTALRVTSNSHKLTGLSASSTHTVKLVYALVDGRTSSESPLATGTTWGDDANHDGLPDDWQRTNWGKPANWPSPDADSDHDGASNTQEFLAGTDPTDPSSVLKTRIETAPTQRFLVWNTRPGFFYQAQTAMDPAGPWNDLGSSRFANGPTDSVSILGTPNEAFFRVIQLR